MRRNCILVLLVSVLCFHKVVNGHHNDTCEQEEEGFKNCMKRFFDTKRTTNRPATQAPGNSSDEDIERCFTSSGCQKPILQGQQIDADLDRIKVCKQQLRQKTQSAIKECVEKKASDHIVQPDDDYWTEKDKDEQEKKWHYRQWALSKQTQDTTICPVAANGEKVRQCLWKRSPSTEEYEKWQREFCNAKKDCMKESVVQILCHEHMNITRSLKCDCAQERGAVLKQEYYDCIGMTKVPIKDENDEQFWELQYCKTVCPID